MSLPISIVVVTKNEENNILRLLHSLEGQEYDGEVEIIIVDDSSDNTMQLVKSFSGSTTKNLRLLHCKGGLSQSRKQGVEQAEYQLIAMIDGDCEAPKYWLRELVGGYLRWKQKQHNLAGVGGSNIPFPHGNKKQKIIGLVKNTYLGSGGSIYGMSYDNEVLVSHIATVNCLYERSFLRQAMFHEKLQCSGEDLLMSRKVADLGGSFAYLPRATVYHELRDSYLKWIVNMYYYGVGRMQVMILDPCTFLIQPVYIFPLLLIVLFVVSFLFVFLSPGAFIVQFLWGVLGIYFVIVASFAFYVSIRAGKIGYFLDILLLYIIMHVAYGIGQFVSLLKIKK